MLVAGAVLVAVPPAGAAPTRTVPLVLYSSQGFGPAMARAFQHATGIRVEIDTSTTTALIDEVEATKSHPRWGVLWIDGATAIAPLDRQHLLLRGYRPPVDWNRLGSANVPKDRSYLPTGIILTEAEIYTTRVVSSPPTSWQQLLDPQWKGAVGMDSPTMSGTAYPFVAGMMQHLGGRDGVRAGEQYFTEFHRNGLVVRTVDRTVLQEVTRGKLKVALVQSTAAVALAHTDPTIAVRYLAPVTQVAMDLGIDAGASKAEKAEAERFEQFVFSPDGQHVMQTSTPDGGSLYYPVVNGQGPAATLPPLSSIQTQRLTASVWGSRQHAIDAWFSSHVSTPTAGGSEPTSARRS